jgi:sugar phosphate isomerase/epimerase
MKLGVFTVSLPEYTPEECLEKAHEFGYDGLQWRIFEDHGDNSIPGYWSGNRNSMSLEKLNTNAKGLTEKARAYNLSMESFGTYIHTHNSDEIKQCFETAQSIGVKSIRFNTNYYDDKINYQKQISKLKKQFEKVCKLAQKYQIKALIETRVGQLTPTITKAMKVLDDLPHENVGILWDPGNQVEEGLEDYQMAIDTAGKYLAQIHVKNMKWEQSEHHGSHTTWKTSACPIHKGIVNWPSLISLLKQHKYNGWLFFEDFSSDHSTDHKLKYNIKWFRELIATA